LRAFSGPPKKSALQPARYEAFTKGAKIGHLYDSDVFGLDTEFTDFLRNSLKINRMSFNSARTEMRQKRVTYNNTPFAKPEKRGLFRDVSFFKFREVPNVDSCPCPCS